MVNIPLEPKKLIQYLTIVTNQRERMLTKAKIDYGHDHAIVHELEREVNQINFAIADLRQPLQANIAQPTAENTNFAIADLRQPLKADPKKAT